MINRVVITGMGGVTALGNDATTIFSQMRSGKTAIRNMSAWHDIQGLNTKLGAPIADFQLPEHFSRKKTHWRLV